MRICEAKDVDIAIYIKRSFEKNIRGEAGFEKTYPVAKIKNQLPDGKGSDV